MAEIWRGFVWEKVAGEQPLQILFKFIRILNCYQILYSNATDIKLHLHFILL